MENLNDNESNFSEDSLEISSKPKKKIKKIKRNSKEKVSYKQIYLQRLASELLKGVKPNQLEESKKYPTRSNSRVNLNDSKTKSHSVSWSEFLTNKFKVHPVKSNVDEKLEMLNKRLDYGKRMNSINRINHLCMKSAAKRAIEREPSFQEETKNEVEVESIFPIPTEKQHFQSNMNEIESKLQQMKLRHRNDLKIVEKIRNSL